MHCTPTLVLSVFNLSVALLGSLTSIYPGGLLGRVWEVGSEQTLLSGWGSQQPFLLEKGKEASRF